MGRKGWGSIWLDAEEIEEAIQFVVGSEADFDGAAPGAVAEADAGGEAIAEAVFDIEDVGIAGGRDGDGGGNLLGLGGEQLGDEFLGLADGEGAGLDLIGGGDLEGG